MLMQVTNSSVVYHWIRGQSLFKLYMIKAVIEISDMLFKGFGLGIIENFARDFHMLHGSSTLKSVMTRVLDVIAMAFYVWIHSFLLTMEMFTLHVALTSSEDSIFSFLFYNNFAELKITVFKKVDTAGLYQYACNDGVERLQYFLYLGNILLSTSQDRRVMLKYIVIIFLSEALIDSIKHFFITRLNRLRTELYIDFKN
jgi:Eukaryotic membrane protein family